MPTVDVEELSQFHEQRLLKYACADGSDSEVLWNTRIGFVPLELKSPVTGEFMQLVEIGELNPNYVPPVGSRAIVDMTPQRGRIVAAEVLEDAEKKAPAQLQELFATREEALEEICKAIVLCKYDVVTVTSGFIQELEEYRKDGTPVAVTEGPMDPDPAPEPSDGRDWHFDRKGKPISMEQWMMLSDDRSYKVLKRTEINNNVCVSTIWIGLDHSFSLEPTKPVIFETMVFRRLPKPMKGIGGRVHDFDEDGVWRYCTEEHAFAGHERVCKLMRAKEAAAAQRRD